MDEKEIREGRSLAETPTWTVATVITVMVALGFCLNGSLERLGKWVLRTRRKALLAALEKIKEELMLFGVLSLLMGHWILFVAKICVKSSVFSSSRFYPCAMDGEICLVGRVTMPRSDQFLNMSVMNKEQVIAVSHGYCPQGHESFASHESLEQLHRLVFVLGVTHVLYSFTTIALAMIKIYSWRAWEDEAKTIALQRLQDAPETEPKSTRFRRLTTFIFHQTSHPWSKHRVLVWLLCFTRQFWSSINRSDYMALRLGFITTHQLPLSYDFHNYMLRSMEDEFRDIVGISVYLWIYTIFCIFLDFHGSHIYFWLSFLPAILILLIGTKLHRVVVKLAVETMDSHSHNENRQFNLRDELFWFGRPRLLLWLIHLISFQNAFEMATFIWSLWEIREPSCFMENRTFLVIRIVFGVSSQFWCSFITFPLYVIVTQMGSSFKKSLMSENIRGSLLGWRRRVQAKKGNSTTTALLTGVSTRSSDFDHDHVVKDMTHKNVDDDSVSITNRGSSVGFKTNTSCEHEQEDVENPFELHDQTTEIYSESSQSDDERLQFSHFDDDAAHYDSYSDDERLQFSHFDDDAAHYDSYREDVYHDDER